MGLSILITVISVLIMIAFYTLAERKLLASIQRRKGPSLVGFGGSLQAFADEIGVHVIAYKWLDWLYYNWVENKRLNMIIYISNNNSTSTNNDEDSSEQPMLFEPPQEGSNKNDRLVYLRSFLFCRYCAIIESENLLSERHHAPRSAFWTQRDFEAAREYSWLERLVRLHPVPINELKKLLKKKFIDVSDFVPVGTQIVSRKDVSSLVIQIPANIQIPAGAPQILKNAPRPLQISQGAQTSTSASSNVPGVYKMGARKPFLPDGVYITIAQIVISALVIMPLIRLIINTG